jgi:hypothetical protein
MTRHITAQPPTFDEIAQILGIHSDMVLQWIIEGKLLVAMQGSQTIMRLDSGLAVKNQTAGGIIILTKKPPNKNWPAGSC